MLLIITGALAVAAAHLLSFTPSSRRLATVLAPLAALAPFFSLCAERLASFPLRPASRWCLQHFVGHELACALGLSVCYLAAVFLTELSGHVPAGQQYPGASQPHHLLITESHRSPYAVLGVTPNDSPEAVKSAFRALCRAHHPDRFATAPAAVVELEQQRMSEINAAMAWITRRFRRPSL